MSGKTVLFALILCAISCPLLKAWNVKLVDSSGIDASEMKCLVRTVTRGCETDQQKMEALWGFITQRPFYHWCEAREGREAITEYGIVYDPIKAFNVYGTVICYQVADMLANMAQEIGLPARTRGFPGKHKVMEAYYDGDWHLFDAQYDCQAVYYEPGGREVASLNEVDSNPGYYLFEQPRKSDPFFQFEKFGGIFWPWETRQWVLENWYEAFETDELGCQHPHDSKGHRINICLHRGESLIRYWDNQGKWYCTPEMQKRWKRDLTQRWVDLGPHDPRDPGHTYANGMLIYRPDWAASEENFLDGLYAGENYRLVDGRVQAHRPGWARVVFELSSPYLLAGHPNRLSVDGDSEGGSIFEANFYRATENTAAGIDISLDNGVSWRELWRDSLVGSHHVELDFTGIVEGTYGYLLRVGLESREPGDVSLAGLELRNSIFYSPVLLPEVRSGSNEFELSLSADGAQLCLEPDLSSLKSLEKHCFSVDNLELGNRFNDRLKPPEGESGSVVLEVDPPGGGLIHRMSVYGSFGVDTRAGRDDLIQISYAEKSPHEWKTLYEAPAGKLDSLWLAASRDKPGTPVSDHWRFDRTIEASPAKPVSRCYVRYTIRRHKRLSLNKMRVYAYYEPERPGDGYSPQDILVTHTWMENGELHSHSETPRGLHHFYTVEAGDSTPVNESIAIEVRNKGRR